MVAAPPSCRAEIDAKRQIWSKAGSGDEAPGRAKRGRLRTRSQHPPSWGCQGNSNETCGSLNTAGEGGTRTQAYSKTWRCRHTASAPRH